ncbi:hypothetical protein [Streptococcus suis]|uniref:hypothetical protein n=1 Tax=Streptococcus suis TaxID=1307 RepID=UPI0038D0CBCC
MKLIGNILRWIWRTFWGLIWLSMVLLACGLGLLFYFQQEAAPQMLQTLAQEVQLMVKGQSEVTIEEGVNTIKHLTTDTVNTADYGRWESNTATVYIETQNPTFVAAYETAIANWNATGAFIFYYLSSLSRYLTKNILSSIVKIRKLFYFGLHFSVKSAYKTNTLC